MTTPISTSSTSTTNSPPSSGPAPAVPAPRGSRLESDQGKTTIADAVVTKIAGLAAREIPGVHGFGGGAARAFGALTDRIPGARASSSQGVSVEVGDRQAAVDLTIVGEYGVAIADLARAVRRNVIASVEQMTGLQVVEVNINVVDLYMAGDSDSDQDKQPTVPSNRVR